MNNRIFGTKKCNDTKKAERFFKERGIEYQFTDIKNPKMREIAVGQIKLLSSI